MQNPLRSVFCYMLLGIGLATTNTYAQHTFEHPFAPTDAFVKPQEKPYRDAVCLNGQWQFAPIEKAEKLPLTKIKNPDMPDDSQWETTPVKVPSPWNVNSFARGDGSGGDFLTYPSYPDKWEHVRAGWLMRSVPYKKEWRGKRLILHFDAVGGYTQVFINKQKVGENFEVFLPFELDVTNYLKEGRDNELMLWVADAQLFNQPGKYGRRIHVAGSFWGQHAIGIWQDVNLLIKPNVSIQNTFVKSSLSKNELMVEATISNNSDEAVDVTLSGKVSPWINQAGKDVISAPEPKWQLGATVLTMPNTKVKVAPHAQTVTSFKVKVAGQLHTWDTENPQLYTLILNATNGKQEIDSHYTRFGWREFSLSGTHLLLNGKHIVLKGDSWHFMGIPQMTRRYAWAWYKMLKDNHANAVRLHAQPYPQFYLDMADEMGICVLDETGMWASDGRPKIDGEAYWHNADEHLRRFILRDRNHPSVFGWSVCNENLPVAINVFHAPDSLVQRQVAAINKWIAITREMDTSRPWISGDGETDAPINSPVIIGHYGGSDDNYRKLSSQNKPWGIGEAGMAYYATPLQTAQYNGNRSYTSQAGRMEGVADEATKLINMLKKYQASYMSVFNLVWYGLKPLELGLRDTTRAPKRTDGIFFGKYREGEAGVQPERLGPYTTTLNPGYDLALPLYKSWPLLTAVSSSFADTSMHAEAAQPTNHTTVTPTGNKAVVLLSAEKNGLLQQTLTDIGIELKSQASLNGNEVLIIDGLNPPTDNKSVDLEKLMLQKGAKVLIWGASPNSIKAINGYLPYPVTLTDRKATSFITLNTDQLTNGLGNADFYFSEIADKPIITYGLSGEAVKHSKTLLDACNTDWKSWNKRAEYFKTAAVLRSEREAKPDGKMLIATPQEKGTIYVFAINPQLLTSTSLNVTRRMLANLGVGFNSKTSNTAAIDEQGQLTNALLLASFDVSGKTDAEVNQLDLLKDMKPEDYFAGKSTQNHFWEKATATDGVFDLSKLQFDGPKNNAIGYLSFWVYSPRSLSNLLLEPDMPQLDLHVKADDSYQAYLNNSLLKAEPGKNQQTIKALPLEKGWNHLLIKTIQKSGDWKIAVSFSCDKKAFMNDLRTQVSH